MKYKSSRLGPIFAVLGVLSMSVNPALARDTGWGGDHRDRDWGGDHRHRDRGVHAGDILTGLLIIGGIAAIAGATSSGNKQRPPVAAPPPPIPPSQAERGYAEDNRPMWRGNNSIDTVVNRCIAEISRGPIQVSSVDSVSREDSGWRVQGRSTQGRRFSCSVDGNGRFQRIAFDGFAN